MVYKERPYSGNEAAPTKGEDGAPCTSGSTKQLPARNIITSLPIIGHDNKKVGYTFVNIRQVPEAVDNPSPDSNQLNQPFTLSKSIHQAVSADLAYVDASIQTDKIQNKVYVSKGTQTKGLDEKECKSTQSSFNTMPSEYGDDDDLVHEDEPTEEDWVISREQKLALIRASLLSM